MMGLGDIACDCGKEDDRSSAVDYVRDKGQQDFAAARRDSAKTKTGISFDSNWTTYCQMRVWLV